MARGASYSSRALVALSGLLLVGGCALLLTTARAQGVDANPGCQWKDSGLNSSGRDSSGTSTRAGFRSGHLTRPLAGEETNLEGDSPQEWCGLRSAANPKDIQQTTLKLNDNTVLGAEDLYTCHQVGLPADMPDNREITGVKVATPGSSKLHEVVIMECPAGLWFVQDAQLSPDVCLQASAAMAAACHRWGITAVEANKQHAMCSPPGLIYGRAGELKKSNRVLIVQMHWVVDSQQLNKAVHLPESSLSLTHEPSPAPGADSQLMGTLEATAMVPSSFMQHKQGLTLPAGVDNYTLNYHCARRCSSVALGRMSPKPVTITGYSFKGRQLMTGATIRIKRCPINGLPDAEWKVAGPQGPLGRPTYDILNRPVQLYPGDEMSWSCSYNTSGADRAVQGGYGAFSEERCAMQLHYWPRKDLLQGCQATPKQDGFHALCNFEIDAELQTMNAGAREFPFRVIIAPRTFPANFGNPGLHSYYKASMALLLFLFLTAFSWGAHAFLLNARFLGPINKAYRSHSSTNQRNTITYLSHIIFDTVVLIYWTPAFFEMWCGCSDPFGNSAQLQGGGLYIVAAYALELVWRHRVDSMLAIHHVAAISIIMLLLGEAAWALYKVGDAALLLAYFATLEQPTFVALVLKRMLPEGSIHVLRAWKVAVWAWFFTKCTSMVMATWFIYRDWDLMPMWVRVSFITSWVLISMVQFWSGFIQMNIVKGLERDVRKARARVAGSGKGEVSKKVVVGAAGALSSDSEKEDLEEEELDRSSSDGSDASDVVAVIDE